MEVPSQPLKFLFYVLFFKQIPKPTVYDSLFILIVNSDVTSLFNLFSHKIVLQSLEVVCLINVLLLSKKIVSAFKEELNI